MVMLAKQPPHWFASGSCRDRPLGLPFPSPRREAREELNTSNSCQRSAVSFHSYRLLNWKRLRAPFCPYFLRSLPRESRVTKPSAFSFLRNSALKSMSAREIPSFTASACPSTPPPETFARTLNVPAVSVEASGCLAATRCDGVTKYSSKARPLTLNSPLPGRRYTRAIAVLRRPVP